MEREWEGLLQAVVLGALNRCHFNDLLHQLAVPIGHRSLELVRYELLSVEAGNEVLGHVDVSAAHIVYKSPDGDLTASLSQRLVV